VVDTWYGLWAPKKTPKPILDMLERVLQVAVQDPAFKARLADLSSVAVAPEAATPEALRTQLKSELDRWGTVIKQAGVVPE
jgi:tripartite-type tricarboxylate transporter receptor subunit TctC